MSGIQHSPERRPRALADIGYNNLINDAATSSEDEAPEIRAIAPAEVQSLVGVSLGRAQTRFILPQTPAAEKQAAIDEQGGFFGGPQIQDDADLDDDDAPIQEVERTSRPVTRERRITEERPTTEHRAPATTTTTSGDTTVRLPSPWRAGPKKFKKTNESRSMLKDGFHRRSSSTGPGPMSGMGASLDHWRDALKTSIHNFTSPFSTQHPQDADNKTRPPNRQRRSGSLFASFASLSSSSSTQNLPTRPRTNHSTNHSTASTLVDSRPHLPENAPTTLSKESISESPSNKPHSNHLLQHPKTMPMQRDPPSNESTASNGNPQFVPIRPASSKTMTGQPENALSPMARVNSGRSHRSLRRSASESSLHTFRTLSRVPSLGDDSRFEHVQAQVNSRMKAIRDSWQDTNIRLPLLPSFASLSDISLNRANSFSKKNPNSNPSSSNTTLPSSANQKQSTNLPRATTAPQASKTAQQHPQFAKALAELTGDVVVLGGYRGSILRSAEPPHRQLWAPIKVGLNVRKVDLEVGLDADADERAQEKIIPGGMLTHIGPVDISRRLFKRLRACENARSGQLRVHDYGYDWRLDPNFLSKQLIEFLGKLPCNKPGTPKDKRGAVVIAHSLGGLITRHAVNQRPELFAGVVYAGVPRTCVNILGPFRNGDDVLLSSRVLTAQVNFTIRTSFALLPLDGRCFFNKETKEEYPVDFFDPQTWIDYRLSPCIARPLPSLNEPPPPTGLAGVMNSMAGVMNSMVPGRNNSISRAAKQTLQHPAAHAIDGLANPPEMDASAGSGNSANAEAKGNIDYNGTDNMTPNIDSSSTAASKSPDAAANDPNTSIATTVTIPRDQAIAYLTRILASVKKFKTELFFHAPHAEANRYPPAAVIYGKTTPTVYGAKVVSREAIKHASAYDALAFASGDGVVLAKAAMLPDGYKVARGGLVSSERGHVTLLGDLEAVGRCLRAVSAARRKGVGMGER